MPCKQTDMEMHLSHRGDLEMNREAWSHCHGDRIQLRLGRCGREIGKEGNQRNRDGGWVSMTEARDEHKTTKK